MKKIRALIGVSTSLLLTWSCAAWAQPLTLNNTVRPNVVTPADTFTFCISGYNSAGTTGYILGSGETATFGTTQTYTAAGYNGQSYTITSSESTSGTQTTDTFTVSTPTSFLTSSKVSGTTITQLFLEIGDANSGVGVATGANTVDYSLPVTNYISTGSTIYSSSNTNLALTPNVTLTNGNESLAEYEGVSSGSAISGLAVHSFTFSITYDTVPAAPEASVWGAAGGSLMLLMAGCKLRRRFT